MLYTILGLPLFLLVFSYISIVAFALFLPSLDRTVGNRQDKTIYNTEGNYSATFIKTGSETNGAYELVQVELEPFGGNDWHYHRSFVEQFTLLEGKVKIGRNDKEYILRKGESAVADKADMHFFKNAQSEKALLLVKITPASGLEKTLRVAKNCCTKRIIKSYATIKNPCSNAGVFYFTDRYEYRRVPG